MKLYNDAGDLVGLAQILKTVVEGRVIVQYIITIPSN
jgi:hypothetical protein